MPLTQHATLIALGAVLACVLVGPPSRAEDPGPRLPALPANEATPEEEEDEFKPIEWGPRGLDICSRDGNYHAHIDWRPAVGGAPRPSISRRRGLDFLVEWLPRHHPELLQKRVLCGARRLLHEALPAAGRRWDVSVGLRDPRFVRFSVASGGLALKIELVNDVPSRVGQVSSHPVLGRLDTACGGLAPAAGIEGAPLLRSGPLRSGGNAFCDLAAMKARTAEEWALWAKLAHVFMFLLLVSLGWFVVASFRTARRWPARVVTVA